MPVYPLYYKVAGVYAPLAGYGYSLDKKQIIRTQPQPQPPSEPTTVPTTTTTTTTRSFDLPLGQITGKKGFGFRIGDMIVRGDGYIDFKADHIVMMGAAPRLYVYDEPKAKRWKNVDITVEYMRVSESSPPSYAGLGIGVRSIHEQQTSTKLVVPTYYCKHTFDGRFFFEKEYKHGSSYTKRPSIAVPMKPNTWYTMNFKVTTHNTGGAKLEASHNSGHSITYADMGNWDNTAVIKEGVSCFIRNDSVKDFRVRKFSIREIA